MVIYEKKMFQLIKSKDIEKINSFDNKDISINKFEFEIINNTKSNELVIDNMKVLQNNKDLTKSILYEDSYSNLSYNKFKTNRLNNEKINEIKKFISTYHEPALYHNLNLNSYYN